MSISGLVNKAVTWCRIVILDDGVGLYSQKWKAVHDTSSGVKAKCM